MGILLAGTIGLEVNAADQPLGLQPVVNVGVIVSPIPGIDLGRQPQGAILVRQGGKSLVVYNALSAVLPRAGTRAVTMPVWASTLTCVL